MREGCHARPSALSTAPRRIRARLEGVMARVGSGRTVVGYPRRRLLRGGLLAGAGAALLAACGGDDKGKSGGQATGAAPQGTAAAAAPANAPQRGGTLTLAAQSQFGNLHPQGVGGSDLVRDYVYDRLFNYDYNNGTYELSIAAS